MRFLKVFLDWQTHSRVQKPKLRAAFALIFFSIKLVVTPHNTNSRKDRELNEQICSMIGVVQAVVLLHKKLSLGLITTTDTPQERETPFEMEDNA